MTVSIRQLRLGDEELVNLLAREDPDFDFVGRGAPGEPLDASAVEVYLSNPDVLHWVAQREGATVGHLYCRVVRKRAGEILLYDVAVRTLVEEQELGSALLDALWQWLEQQRVRGATVLADTAGAVEFYKACGFEMGDVAPVRVPSPA